MKSNSTCIELSLSFGALLCVIVAVVLGPVWENPGQIFFRDLIRPFAILFCISAIGAILCALISRPLLRVLPIAIFLLFAWSTIAGLIPGRVWDAYIALLLLTLIFAAVFIWSRRVRGIVVARVVIVVTGAMTTATVLVVVPQFIDRTTDIQPIHVSDDFSKALEEFTGDGSASFAELPDIVYVVPDRYGSRATLLAHFDWDNTEFYEALNERGFFVNPDAWANYATTSQSLASTLNSGYLDRVAEAVGPNRSNGRPLRRILEDNLVQQGLRKIGYRYIHSGHWWALTEENRNADENVRFKEGENLLWQSEFERTLWHKTPLPRIYLKVWGSKDRCEFIKRQLDYLRNVGNDSQPVFVFAHVPIPHDPITMDENGKCLERDINYPQRPY